MELLFSASVRSVFLFIIIIFVNDSTSGFVISNDQKLRNGNVGQAGLTASSTARTEEVDFDYKVKLDKRTIKSTNVDDSGIDHIASKKEDTRTTPTTTELSSYEEWLYKYKEKARKEKDKRPIPEKVDLPTRFPWVVVGIVCTSVGILALLCFQESFCAVIINERIWRRRQEGSAHGPQVPGTNGVRICRLEPEQAPQDFLETAVVPRIELTLTLPTGRNNPEQLIAPFPQPNHDPPPPYPTTDILAPPPPNYSEIFS